MSSHPADRPTAVIGPRAHLDRRVAERAVSGPIADAPVRLVICHPAPLTGQAIAATLRRAGGVGEVVVCESASDLVRVTTRGFDVALASETLGADLPELLQALLFRGVFLPVVVMTTSTDPDLAARCFEWGAAGTVDVRRPVAELLRAVRVATTGAAVVDERQRDEVVARLEARAQRRENARRVLQALSTRERQVLESLGRGTGVTEIARAMHLSPHTIRACLRTLGPKLDVAGQLQIAAVARELMTAAHQPAPSRHLQRLRSGVGALSMTS